MSGDKAARCGVVTAGQFRSWAATHAGSVRRSNEDALVNRPDLGLWAVADGAGGHSDGATASRMIAEALDGVSAGLGALDLLADVRARILGVHAQLRQRVEGAGGALTASTVVVLLARDEHFACLWAGDSRAYLLRQSELRRVTRDHSLVQALVDSGALAEDEAESHPQANVITRAVGADEEALELEKVTEPLLPGDRFLLCSDGLFKALPEGEAAVLLGSDETATAEHLLLAALARRARDNVTAVIVEVLPDGTEPAVLVRQP